jgi:hypothetical protein
LKGHNKTFSFTKNYENLTQVLTDRKLASLGDAYVNFACSLALSGINGKPTGVKVKGSVLAEAVKKTQLRQYMPSRMTRHMLADAAESLIVYAWLRGDITINETATILAKGKDQVEDFRQLLTTVKNRITFP